MGFNATLFRMINGLAFQNAVLDKIMIFMSEYAPDIFMAVLAAVYIKGLVKKNKKMRVTAIDTFIIIVLNLFLGYIIGFIWYIPRPFVNNKVNLLVPHAADASFPSDHAIGTMSIAIGISRYNKVYGIILGVLSILVGISRVFVGHHYPTDVLGGYITVFIVSFLYESFLKENVQSIYFKVEKMLAKRIPVLEPFL